MENCPPSVTGTQCFITALHNTEWLLNWLFRGHLGNPEVCEGWTVLQHAPLSRSSSSFSSNKSSLHFHLDWNGSSTYWRLWGVLGTACLSLWFPPHLRGGGKLSCRILLPRVTRLQVLRLQLPCVSSSQALTAYSSCCCCCMHEFIQDLIKPRLPPAMVKLIHVYHPNYSSI